MTQKDHPWIQISAIIWNKTSDKLLLIKRGSRSFHGMWALPSGKMDWDEEVKDTVKREVKEETGLEIEVVKFVGRYYDRRGRHPRKTMICLPHICHVLGGTLQAGDDALEARWFAIDEIRQTELAFDHREQLTDEGII